MKPIFSKALPTALLCVLPFTALAQNKTYEELAKSQYFQSDMNAFMGCAGKFEGGFDTLTRLQNQTPEAEKSFYTPYIDRATGINTDFETIRTAGASFAPHVDMGAATSAYTTARAPFDNLSGQGIRPQWDHWKKNAAISPACIDVYKKTKTLYLIWEVQE